MTPQDVKNHFRTGYNFRKVTLMSDNTLRNWIKVGYVPYMSQKKIEKITNGKLQAVWDDSMIERDR